MMNLSHLLKKKDKTKDEVASPTSLHAPQFTFLRTTTTTQEAIDPPSFPGDPPTPLLAPEPQGVFGRLRRLSSASAHSHSGTEDGKQKKAERLHFGRNKSSTSVNVPDNLPDIGGDGVARTVEDEEKWEKRATILVTGGALNQGTSAPSTPGFEITSPVSSGGKPSANPSADEADIQEAIRLHEKGNLEASTALFGRLADPNGANNALAQVLYGLALRHAWGCEPHQEQAVHYLSLAASNSAEVEKLALGAGMKKRWRGEGRTRPSNV